MVQGINFAIIAKFILQRLLGFRETFQLPSRFIKSPPPPPPPPPPPNFHSVPFRSSLEPPQSRVPPLMPCVFALHCRRTHQLPPLPVRAVPVPGPTAHRRRSLLGSDSHQNTGAAPSRHLQFPTVRFSFPAMVRTHGAHRYKPKVQFSTPEKDGVGTSRVAAAHSPDQVTETPPALAPASISEEARASEPPSRRYQTRVGPWAPSPVHPRPCRRAPPSKRARTSGLGESSLSRPEPSPPPTDQSSSHQLSPHTRITRPMFSCDPIPGNVNLRARDFHGEPYYDIPALTADQRFRD